MSDNTSETQPRPRVYLAQVDGSKWGWNVDCPACLARPADNPAYGLTRHTIAVARDCREGFERALVHLAGGGHYEARP